MCKTLICGLLLGLSTVSPPALGEPNSAPQKTKKVVERAFADTPVLIKIAKCESGFRQFNKNGRPLKNPSSSATGVMQLMSSYHRSPAKRRGWDINTLQGNLAYAKFLYKSEGTRPWNASRHCWAA